MVVLVRGHGGLAQSDHRRAESWTRFGRQLMGTARQCEGSRENEIGATAGVFLPFRRVEGATGGASRPRVALAGLCELMSRLSPGAWEPVRMSGERPAPALTPTAAS